MAVAAAFSSLSAFERRKLRPQRGTYQGRFAVAEDDELFAAELLFQLADGVRFGCGFRHDFEPLLAGVDVFGVDNVVGFAVFFVKMARVLRITDAGDIEKIAARELFCRIHLAGTGVVYAGIGKVLQAGRALFIDKGKMFSAVHICVHDG